MNSLIPSVATDSAHSTHGRSGGQASRRAVPCTLAVLSFALSALAQGPAALSPDWSTYVGGSGADRFYAAAPAPGGRVIMVGQSLSTNFPATAGAHQTALSGASDAVVACFDAGKGGAQQCVWASYFGGSGDEAAYDVHVDPTSGVVTIAGWTSSTNLKTANPCQSMFGGGAQDMFAARLSADGTQLLYATYLGGSDDDWSSSLAVDAQGRVTLCGVSYSTNFPMVSAYQPTSGGKSDLVLARLDPTKTAAAQLVWSTYLGGAENEGAWITYPNALLGYLGADVAVDAQGVVTVASRSSSRNYPTTAGAFQTTHAGLPLGTDYDACVSRLDPSKTGSAQLVWSTYLGGGGTEGAMRVAVDALGVVTIMGYSESGSTATLVPKLPTTPGVYQPAYAGGLYDDFVGRIAADGKSLVWLTYIGGASDREYTFAMHVDNGGAVTIGGYSYSKALTGQFPTTAGCFQATQSVLGPFDAVLCRLSQDARRLDYSSYIGGDSADVIADVVPDGRGGLWIAGLSQSTDFPTSSGAYQPALSGTQDGLAARWDPLPMGVRRIGTSTASCRGPIHTGVTQMPSKGLPGFRLTCTSAPPQSAGVLLLGNPRPSALAVLGVRVFVDTAMSFAVPTGTSGYVETPLPLQAGTIGLRLGLQYVWVNTASCGGVMTLSASDALDLTIL